jgi:hypothetical protein
VGSGGFGYAQVGIGRGWNDEASIGTTCLPARIDYLAAAASLALGYLPLASAATAVNLPKP